jgi:hypothetical protein
MPQSSVVLDAATRFLRANPELLDVARTGASETGQSIETLLADAVRRIRRSGFDAVAKQDVIAGPVQLTLLAPSDVRGDGQKQLVCGTR